MQCTTARNVHTINKICLAARSSSSKSIDIAAHSIKEKPYFGFCTSSLFSTYVFKLKRWEILCKWIGIDKWIKLTMHFGVVSTVCVVFSQLVFRDVNGLPDIIRIGNRLQHRKSAVEYLIHFCFLRLLKIRWPIPSGRRQSRACVSLCRRENKSRQNNFTTLKVDSANRTNPTQRQFSCIQKRWAAHKWI